MSSPSETTGTREYKDGRISPRTNKNAKISPHRATPTCIQGTRLTNLFSTTLAMKKNIRLSRATLTIYAIGINRYSNEETPPN
jgi:hypothetical protein